MRRIVPLAFLFACGQEYDVVTGPVEVNPEDVTECPFTPIPGTRFQRYDCNPVFSGSDEDWIEGGVGSVGYHAEEVLGHPFYQMWYATGMQGGTYALGYAISGDGTNWEPHPDNPVFVAPDAGWNKDSMGAVSVVWNGDSDEYVLAYQGINLTTSGNGLGMLTSPDGVNWTEGRGGESYLELSAPLGGVSYCWPLALAWERTIGFQGYIGGFEGASGDRCEVYGYGGASLDSLGPTDAGLILPSGQGVHDRKGTAAAAVVVLEDIWYMFYVGINEWEPIPDTNFIVPYDTTLNVATSTDGLTWEKSDLNPILPVGLVQNPSLIGNVAAQVVGSRIHLWVDDYYDEVGGTAVGYFLYEPNVDLHP